MNKKYIFTIITIFFVLQSSFTQETPQQDQNTEVQDESSQQQQGQEEQQMSEQQQQEMIRQTYTVGIIMAKHQLNTYGDDFVKLISDQSKGQIDTKFYQKILADHVIECVSKMQHEELIKIISSLNSGTFDIKAYSHFFATITLEKYTSPDFNKALNNEEIAIMRLNDQLEEHWAKQQEEKQEEMDSEYIRGRGRQEPIEPKILGIKANDIPFFYQIGYFFTVIGVFGMIVFFGYRMMDKDERVLPKNKKKQQKTK